MQNYRKSGHGQFRGNLVPPFLRPTWHHLIGNFFGYLEKLRENLNMHFKDDPISDMHAKNIFNYFMSDAYAWALKIWSRLLVPSFPARSRRIQLSEEFNGQFTDVFNKSEHTQVPLPNRSAAFLEDIHVSAEGVTKLLKGLNPSKALGPDELHPRVLKELASELGPMFAHLFQQSNDTGEIPKELSLANI